MTTTSTNIFWQGRLISGPGYWVDKMQDRIEHILTFMEYGSLTDAQHDLVISLEEQFQRKGRLSDKQMELLESIFQYANEK